LQVAVRLCKRGSARSRSATCLVVRSCRSTTVREKGPPRLVLFLHSAQRNARLGRVNATVTSLYGVGADSSVLSRQYSCYQ
jgi:hypothetical protein